MQYTFDKTIEVLVSELASLSIPSSENIPLRRIQLEQKS